MIERHTVDGMITDELDEVQVGDIILLHGVSSYKGTEQIEVMAIATRHNNLLLTGRRFFADKKSQIKTYDMTKWRVEQI